ncbi:preprotein translocase subunit SecG [Defluviicoccus vanus]|uniref:Protein-export membrane protein SecG n=1 Tax=Defluviicoccus vanus TaxID=111831 RepID=A0A7H1N518_9PROT|nr:preprotein translocase subunit SecG [Defluviicoccus vanus]QNT70804.1 preprotein translocase subunit SecG [Defluviicoccus vanus]
MVAFLLAVHILIAIALVCMVLLQRSEGGALGMGGGGTSGFLAGRATANLLTRATAILAAAFIITSLSLGKLATIQRTTPALTIEQPAPLPEPEAAPQAPAAPIAR